MQRLMMEVGPTGRLSHTHLWNTWPHEVTAAVCARFEAGEGRNGARKEGICTFRACTSVLLVEPEEVEEDDEGLAVRTNDLS
jgi:hypothetical protein